LQLVRSVFAANPKTVVVLLNGGPVSLAGGPSVPAVVEMFFAGEEGGNAVAEVLFGDYNPGGKLPYTVYQSVADLPPMDEYDITKGFTYMYFAGKPEYPFGHGLSYTNFTYSNLKISSKRIPGDGQVTIHVDVQNNGSRAGDEVVQLYVHDIQARVKRPKKELRGFERVSLKPGEKRTVAFSLPAEKLSFWDTNKKAFVVEPGAFDVFVGGSSKDIRAEGRLDITTPGQWAN
jgi:beta-glucosidase